MIDANVAKILSSEYNEDFKKISVEIQKAAFAKRRDLNLSHSHNSWVGQLGFEKFKEVMNALGFEVFNNANDYKIRW